MSGVAAQLAIADAPIDEKQTAKGEAIYRAKCASCHGEKGEGGTKPLCFVAAETVFTGK